MKPAKANQNRALSNNWVRSFAPRRNTRLQAAPPPKRHRKQVPKPQMQSRAPQNPRPHYPGVDTHMRPACPAHVVPDNLGPIKVRQQGSPSLRQSPPPMPAPMRAPNLGNRARHPQGLTYHEAYREPALSEKQNTAIPEFSETKNWDESYHLDGETHATVPETGDAIEKPDLSFQSMGKYLSAAYAIIAILILMVGGWAYLSQIKGAVIASGKVAVEGRPQIVEHPEGGIIREIFVQEGEVVELGDPLLRLDPTIVNANLVAAETRYYETKALIARLEAEKNNQANIVWPRDLLQVKSNPRMKLAMDMQGSILSARRAAAFGDIEQIQERLRRLRIEDTGLEFDIAYNRSRLGFTRTELEKFNALLQQGLISRSRIVELEREKNQFNNKLTQLQTQRNVLAIQIREQSGKIEQLQRQKRKDTLNDLQKARIEAENHFENLETLRSKQKRTEIQAPATGVVHNLLISTIGEVVSSNEEIMQIIPPSQNLLITSKVLPQDVDQVSIGQSATVVFSALNQKVPPELMGTVSKISANSLPDIGGGGEYYSVQIEISDEEVLKLQGQPLIAGMPADVYIQTNQRSVLNYILSPLRDALGTSMRDGT